MNKATAVESANASEISPPSFLSSNEPSKKRPRKLPQQRECGFRWCTRKTTRNGHVQSDPGHITLRPSVYRDEILLGPGGWKESKRAARKSDQSKWSEVQRLREVVVCKSHLNPLVCKETRPKQYKVIHFLKESHDRLPIQSTDRRSVVKLAARRKAEMEARKAVAKQAEWRRQYLQQQQTILSQHPEYGDPIKVAELISGLQASIGDLTVQLKELQLETNRLGTLLTVQTRSYACHPQPTGVPLTTAATPAGITWSSLATANDDMLKVLTGCTRATFENIDDLVTDFDLQDMWLVSGPGSQSLPDVRIVFLWVLITLRLGLPKSICGHFLGIGNPVNKGPAFQRATAILASALGVAFDGWFTPPFQKLCRTQPFLGGFSYVHLIGDCSSTPCQAPAGNHKQRKFLFSAYYGCHCVKWGIAINAAGFIEWVSQGYCGNSGDDLVCAGLERAVNPGWTLMYDKGGGSLRHKCESAGVGYKTPHSVSQGRLTTAEFKASREISGRRSHVERAVRRFKEWRFWTSTIATQDFELVDNLLKITAVLCNLNSPIIIHPTTRGASEPVVFHEAPEA